MTAGVKYKDSGARISRCGRYRVRLWRTWGPGPIACLIMLNPSTADGREDDPTIRSCVRLLKELGFGGFVVVNLYSFRATEPDDLPMNPATAIGPGNARAIEEAVTEADLVICAWGANKRAARAVGGALDIIELNRRAVYCFGETKAGAPRHPLYVKSGTQLDLYRRFR